MRPVITPYLYYEDPDLALDWLANAFGFEERAGETVRANGVVVHAAMELDEGVIMLGRAESLPSPPRSAPPRMSLHVSVRNLRAHYERAKKVGARIIAEPEDTLYGDRRYGAADLEGHHWYFAVKQREVSAVEWNPADPEPSGA